MAKDWLHCNECFIQPDKKAIRYYLTNCSHIFCEKCVESCTTERCKLCKAQCTTLPLAGKIPKQVEEMFSDPVDYFKKQIKPSIQTFEFHKSQQKRLHRHNQQKLKFLEAQIGEAKKFMMQAKQIEKEFKRLKAENEYFKSLINKESYAKCSPVQRHKSPSSTRSRSPHGGNASISGRDISPMMARQMNSGPVFPNSSGRPTPPSQKMPHCSNINGRPTPPSQQIRLNNNGRPNHPGFSGRLLVRSPPEGGQLGSIQNNRNNRNFGRERFIAATPDSGYNDSGADTPLTVPRPINFDSASEDSVSSRGRF